MKFQILKLQPIGVFVLAFATMSMMTFAQGAKTLNNLYCGGYVQSSPINTNNFIVGAEFEADRHNYSQGDTLVIKGSNYSVGDTLSVVRPRGRVETRWTKKDNLGFFVQELGTVEIVKVKNNISIAMVKTSCDNMLLGDLLVPVAQRTLPALREKSSLDVFGDPNGKATGRIFMARDSMEMLSSEQIVYIDLGAEDNVQTGDYLTIYRPLGTGNIIDRIYNETASAREEGFQSNEYRGGKFSNQAQRKKGEKANGMIMTSEDARSNRPENIRRVVGEMVILNVKEKTATALITRTTQEVHTGDFVEVQ
ncbi:MAG: hypothetical protein ABIP06_00545 [Pyrinomonadaceae bacterium]